MNKNIPFHIAAIALFIILKFWMGAMNSYELGFILTPTNALFEIISGSASHFNPETGHYHEQFNIVIDKSCSGYNFLLICMVMLIFLATKYLKDKWHKIISFPICFIGAYIITLFINTSRIYASLILQDKISNITNIHINHIHESIGITINLSFLIAFYLIIDKTLNKRHNNINSS